jgi:isopenicillin N synthase-like dioxygenase
MSEVDVGSVAPIIDVTECNQNDVIIRACLDHGFFYVDNRRGQLMDLKTIPRLMEMGPKFFALPSSVKQKYSVTQSKYLRGYVDGSTYSFRTNLSSVQYAPSTSFTDSRSVTSNVNELILFGASQLLRDPQNVNLKPSNCDEAESAVADLEDGNFYPEEVGEEFEIPLKSYFKGAAAIGHKVLAHLQDYLDLDRVRRISSSTVGNGDCNGSSNGTIKIQHWSEALRSNLFMSGFWSYPAGEGSLQPHTDLSVLTVLCQNQYSGMQIFYGGEWIDVKPIENTFLIIVGNVLQEWSHGKLRSTVYQVKNRGLHIRQSLAYFMLMDKDCETYIELQKQWTTNYRYVMQGYYNWFSHLSENAKRDSSSPNCLDGKSAAEIDQFHQETIQRMRSKLRGIANSSSSSSAAVTSAPVLP